MPYLKTKDRDIINATGGDKVTNYLAKLDAKEMAGALNYLNFRIVKKWTEKNGKRYWIFALIIGTLVCCLLEIYRRLIAPYENQKIKESGDVI